MKTIIALVLCSWAASQIQAASADGWTPVAPREEIRQGPVAQHGDQRAHQEDGADEPRRWLGEGRRRESRQHPAEECVRHRGDRHHRPEGEPYPAPQHPERVSHREQRGARALIGIGVGVSVLRGGVVGAKGRRH